MQEIFSGLIVSLDVVALYLLITDVKSRFLLSMWTAILHMIFPVIGFTLGNWMLQIFMQWSNIVSSILLFFIGLQIILSSKNGHRTLPIGLLAITASLDTFSVSISFGMLNLQKYYFILSAGIWTFILSYIALHIAKAGILFKGTPFKWIAGLSLITISVYTLWDQ
ncbi:MULTISPECIES: manganese efflux pump MntP [Ureibacillus]|uniref:Putative Mn2+ efflux pump MntP n=1 Tax=Ureibacillus thermosphaericus TaxID=51173 RepID=A0A840PVN8_URETH|nr:manganese efflux pump [Ureibacillus thermosphaericus]MBB5149993.1 putative Mn2+ efflux pump MntP [Ureibacillus thermosphaericus]NKZ32676.1 hypothetical protein [Ureibacillus thermosphaericus]